MYHNALTVLLVDDDEDDFLIVRDLLADRARTRVRLERAATYAEGLAALARRAHDAYLIDYHLGAHSGIDLVRAAIAAGCEAPLILLTGHDQDDVDLLALAAGATDYLVKGELTASLLERSLRYSLERASSLAALKSSSERYRLVAETATDAIVTMDDAWTITFASEAAEQIFGYRPEELVGHPLELLAPDGLRRSWRPDGLLPGAGPARIGPTEQLARHRSGRTLPVEISVGGAVEAGRAFYTAIIRDVSERHRLEEQLRQAQKMEAIGRLAGGVAHDFNNVLTAIAGYGELLVADLQAGVAPEPADVEQILGAARRAARLTQQLLAFSRKQVLQPEVVSLNAIVAEIEPMLRRLIGEDILLLTDLARDGCQVEVDPGQMQQVILNLAVNARDAMPGGGTLRIATHTWGGPAAPRVALIVSDTGEGMDEETRSHLFEPFFTTKERGKGTGLGLSTVYGIVAQSGGEILVDSLAGGGTTFTVLMPCAGGAPPAPQPAEHADASRGSELVLLVEDDPAVRGLLETVLSGEGYTVISAASGPQALAAAAELAGGPDLLITDVIMPGMSGADLVRQMTLRHPGLRVLFISGYTDDAISAHGVLAPGVAFLQKPFHPADLARKLRAVLDAPAAGATLPAGPGPGWYGSS